MFAELLFARQNQYLSFKVKKTTNQQNVGKNHQKPIQFLKSKLITFKNSFRF